MALNQLIYAIDKNQIWRMNGRSLCARFRKSQRGVMVLRRMTNQMAIRKNNMDISEVRRRVGGEVFRRSACTGYVLGLMESGGANLHLIALKDSARTTSLYYSVARIRSGGRNQE